MTAAFLLLMSALPAAAGISPQDYRNVGVSPIAGASVPLDVAVIDEGARRHRLGELISHPSVLVFADYTCTTLCGPIVAFVASALEQSGLRAGDQFRLIVIGLDPKDSVLTGVQV